MIKISGQTFQHRDYLRHIGAKWNDVEKCWQLHSLSETKLQGSKDRVGIIVSEQKEQVFNPSERMKKHKRKNPGKTQTYGNDETYFNYFKDQNPLAFFGFSTLADFADYIKAVPMNVQRQTDHDRNAGWQTTMPKWYGTPDMNKALKLALHGWNEGIEASEEIIEEITTEYSKDKKRISSLVGGQVNVGKMLSGNPKHMIKRKKQNKKKVTTLFVECAMIHSISPIYAAIRAATICAIADLIEQNGYSCEINAVMIVSRNGTHTLPGAQMCVTLKQANERLNLSDVAFSLGHPSFFRRMIFGAIGSSIECKPIWEGMGYPTSAFDDEHQTKENEFYVRQLLPHQQKKLKRHETLKDIALAMLPLIKPENLEITTKEM